MLHVQRQHAVRLLRLADGPRAPRYVEPAVLGAGDELTLIQPYAVTVRL